MTHYVVINDWAYDCDRGVDVLGVAHSYEEAEGIVGAYIAREKAHAEANYCDAVIETDNKSYIEAYEDGSYNDEHTLIEIREVSN